MNKELFLEFIQYLHDIEKVNLSLPNKYFNFWDYNELFWSPISLLFQEYYTLDGWYQLTEYVYHCGQNQPWCIENGIPMYKDDEYMYQDLEKNFKHER